MKIVKYKALTAQPLFIIIQLTGHTSSIHWLFLAFELLKNPPSTKQIWNTHLKLERIESPERTTKDIWNHLKYEEI